MGQANKICGSILKILMTHTTNFKKFDVSASVDKWKQLINKKWRKTKRYI